MLEFLPLARQNFKPMLTALRPERKGSAGFFQNYIWNSNQFSKHHVASPTELVKVSWNRNVTIKAPTWFPSKQMVNSLVKVNDLQRIYYSGGSLLSSVTFAFGDYNDEIRSPPKGSYDVEPTKVFKFSQLDNPAQARLISFCKSWRSQFIESHQLVAIQLRTIFPFKVYAEVTCNRKVVVHQKHNLKMAAGDKIVSAKVAAAE